MKVKASDPGRDSKWGRQRDKTNLRLARGPPTVTSPRLGIRETTGCRREGRGRTGSWGPGLRQPATEKKGIRAVKTLSFWSGQWLVGEREGEVEQDD